ncbi:hypothetical protein V5799_002235 [Amblyomma americanum]|uniref:Uncharacterized protein n=1 Tax=Amblyomma americanum TaxID=6943 RepID=A0AAQ4CXX3_AMBAM
MEDMGVSPPKHALSVVLDKEDIHKVGVSLGNDVLVQPRLSNQGTAVAPKTATSTHLMQSSASEEIDIECQLLNIRIYEAKGGEGGCAVNIDESIKECCENARVRLAILGGNGEATQRSHSLGQSESRLLDARSRNLGPIHPRDQAENGSREARSSDSTQLSPQPEFSFVWSGSGSATLSWSALKPRFLRSPAPSLWAELPATENDERVAVEGSAHVKNVSVPSRPASPGKDNVRVAGVPRRAKRTVSCPLSFDTEYICYETGDQETFKLRRSSSNCWCCDKDERDLANQDSAHMEIQEYLKLKERLDQRHRVPVPREVFKSDQSGLERVLDMATLDCSGMERHSHIIELFSNSSSSSLMRAVDSWEDWFKEGLTAFYEDFSEDRHGTFPTLPLAGEHRQLRKNKRNRCEFSADDSYFSTPRAHGAVQDETSKCTGKAGISGNTAPGVLSGIPNDEVPGVLYELGKYVSPTGAFKESGESTRAKELAAEGLLVVPTLETAAVPVLPPPQALVVNYTNARCSGMQLAEELDKFATGVSLKDVAFATCRRTMRAPKTPHLSDVDFSKYVTNDTLSVTEALARMPRTVCNKTVIMK